MSQFNGILQRGYDVTEDTTAGIKKKLNHVSNSELQRKRNRFAATRNSNKLRLRNTSFETANSDKMYTLTKSAPPCTVQIKRSRHFLSYDRNGNSAVPGPVATRDFNANFKDQRGSYKTISSDHPRHFENMGWNPSASTAVFAQRNLTPSACTDNVPVLQFVKTAEDVNGNIPNNPGRAGRRHSETSIYSGRCRINVAITLLREKWVFGTDGNHHRAYTIHTERGCPGNHQDPSPKPVPHVPCENKRECEAAGENVKQDDIVRNRVGNHCSEDSLDHAIEKQLQETVNSNAQGAYRKECEVNDCPPCVCESAKGKVHIIKQIIPTEREKTERTPTRATSYLAKDSVSAVATQTTRPDSETSPGHDLKITPASEAPFKSAVNVVSASPTIEERNRRRTGTPGLPRPPPPCTGSEIFIKIILLGDYGVGKTHLIQALHHATRSEEGKGGFHCTAFRRNEFVEMTTRKADMSVRVKIVDTAGLERFRSLTSSYFREAQGCIFVFNITIKDSFNSVIDWHTNMQEYTDVQNTLLLGITTLTQSREARVVTSERALKLAEGIRTRYLEASMAEEDLLVEGVSRMVDRVLKKLNARPDKAEVMTTISPSVKESVRKRGMACCVF